MKLGSTVAYWGLGMDGFDIGPTVQASLSDHRAKARDLMPPVLARYIGGPGSRQQERIDQRRAVAEPAA